MVAKVPEITPEEVKPAISIPSAFPYTLEGDLDGHSIFVPFYHIDDLDYYLIGLKSSAKHFLLSYKLHIYVGGIFSGDVSFTTTVN